MYKSVPGWEDYYAVTKCGKVFSKERKRKASYGSFATVKSRLLKPGTQKGYFAVSLVKDSKVKRITIHRIVWLTYKGPIPKGYQINHIDGDKKNNNLDNLELVTPSQNTQHAWANGLCSRQIGEKNVHSKLSEKEVSLIKEKIRKGESQNKIAKIFNIHQTNVHYIAKGKTWSHVQ